MSPLHDVDALLPVVAASVLSDCVVPSRRERHRRVHGWDQRGVFALSRSRHLGDWRRDTLEPTTDTKQRLGEGQEKTKANDRRRRTPEKKRRGGGREGERRRV